MRSSTKAWIALAAGVIAWELLAPKGELLSHGFDNFLAHHPVATWAVTVMTVGHLLNVLPTRFDPWNGVHVVRELYGG